MPDIGLQTDDEAVPIARSVQPQLDVADILATVSHWQDVIGFPGKWVWGDPPVHTGVNWAETQIQFTLNPELAARAEGQQLAINVTNIEARYARHQSRGAKILAPLETHPWGTALMCVLVEWSRENAPDQSSVTLFTGEQLKEFYARFGFSPSFGMCLTVLK